MENIGFDAECLYISTVRVCCPPKHATGGRAAAHKLLIATSFASMHMLENLQKKDGLLDTRELDNVEAAIVHHSVQPCCVHGYAGC